MGIWKQPPQDSQNSTESGCPPAPQPWAALLSTLPLLVHHPFILLVSTAAHYSVVMIMSHWRSQGHGPQAVPSSEQRRQRAASEGCGMHDSGREWKYLELRCREESGSRKQRQLRQGDKAGAGRTDFLLSLPPSLPPDSLPPSLFSLVYTFLPLSTSFLSFLSSSFLIFHKIFLYVPGWLLTHHVVGIASNSWLSTCLSLPTAVIMECVALPEREAFQQGVHAGEAVDRFKGRTQETKNHHHPIWTDWTPYTTVFISNS